MKAVNANETFKKRIEKLGLSLSSKQEDQLLTYSEEFRKWNKIHNLSAIDQDDAFLTLHLLDSLTVVPHLEKLSQEGALPKQPCIADLGAGGGLPGIPLAIALPNWSFVLIEAVKKKAAFLQHIKGKLHLQNLDVVPERVELYAQKRGPFADATISRAFTELKNFVIYSEGLVKESGLVLAMKSQKAQLELAEIPENWRLLKNIQLKIPDLEAERCLLILQSMRK